MPDNTQDFNINDAFHQARQEHKKKETIDLNLINDSVDDSGRSVATNASVGYHTVKRPMYIKVYKSPKGGPVLQCHYDPKDFTETYAVEYADVPATGSAVSPIQFKVSKPRKWSMKLLFNDLGVNPASRSPGAVSCDSSLAMLHGFTLPLSVGGYGRPGTSSEGDAKKPPVLLVFLLGTAFKCHITSLSVKRLKIDPGAHYTLRAEADVEFTEYIDVPIKKGWW